MNYRPLPDKLRRICDAIVAAPEFKMKNGETYCNLALRKAMDGVELDLFYDEKKKRVMMANEMIDYMEATPSRFGRIHDGTDAFEWAKAGLIVLACNKGEKHGHIALVYPAEEMQHSASWGKLVPMLANVGKRNGIMRASLCFQEEPKYYCILPF